MPSKNGFYGTGVSYEDIMILLNELDERTQDASNQLSAYFETSHFSTTNSDHRLPAWISYPISLHDKLSRWISKRRVTLDSEIENCKEIGTLAMLEDSLIRVGQHIDMLGKLYLRHTPSPVSSPNPSFSTKFRRGNLSTGGLPTSRQELALGASLRKRKSQSDVYFSNYTKIDDVNSMNSWSTDQLTQIKKDHLAEDMQKIHEELVHLKEVTSRLSQEVDSQQSGIDEVQDNVQHASQITSKVNKILKSIVRARQEWIPMGATMGGVGVGLIAGIPGGVIGVTVGALIGGAAFGSAATVLVENAPITREENEEQQRRHSMLQSTTELVMPSDELRRRP